MPFYRYQVPIYPMKEGLLPEGWVQTTLDFTPANPANELLFIGCKAEMQWGHIVIINYERKVICNEWFKLDVPSGSGDIKR